jgi:hypothetical protein
MPGASFERLLDALAMVDAARRRRRATRPALRINYTVASANLAELESFFTVFGRFDLSALQIRPIMDFGGEYREPMQGDDLGTYGRIVELLRRECAKRGVTALITPAGTSYHTPNDRAAILHAVQRHVRPGRVWQDDFDWRHETYAQYCARTGWGRHLLRCASAPIEAVLASQHQRSAAYAARYEVSL